MSKVSTIYSAYIAEMRSVLKTSELLLQREKDGLDGELKTSGSMCEMFVKNLIRAHLPNHLRLTSGYILDATKRNNDDNLAQFDLIIADNTFPPIYKFSNLDIEVVPVESVCAIFEVKRSITEKNVKEFISRLSDSVLKYRGLYKDIEYNPSIVNVSNLGIGINAPLIGLISLSSSLPDAYRLCLMSSLPDNESARAEQNKVYIEQNSHKYVVRSKNKIYEGFLLEDIDLSNLSSRLDCLQLTHIILSFISKENNIILESDVQINDKHCPNIVDFIWSIDGHIELPFKIANPGINGVRTISDILCRPKNDVFANISQDEWSKYINDGNRYLFINDILQDKIFPEKICVKAIGWLTYLLFRLRGRYGIDISEIINNYYLN